MKLIIDDKEIAVERIGVSVKFGVKDLKNPDARKAGKSSTVILLDTEENREAFEYAFDIRSQTLRTYAAVLNHGGFYFPGLLKVNKVKIDNGAKQIEGSVYGDNYVWADRIKTASLQSLDIGAAHTYNNTNVQATLDGTLSYLYALVDYNQFGLDSDSNFVVELSDMLPGVNIKSVLEAILFDYTIQSDWLDKYDNLFTLFMGNPFVLTEKEVESLMFYVGLGFSVEKE